MANVKNAQVTTLAIGEEASGGHIPPVGTVTTLAFGEEATGPFYPHLPVVLPPWFARG